MGARPARTTGQYKCCELKITPSLPMTQPLLPTGDKLCLHGHVLQPLHVHSVSGFCSAQLSSVCYSVRGFCPAQLSSVHSVHGWQCANACACLCVCVRVCVSGWVWVWVWVWVRGGQSATWISAPLGTLHVALLIRVPQTNISIHSLCHCFGSSNLCIGAISRVEPHMLLLVPYISATAWKLVLSQGHNFCTPALNNLNMSKSVLPAAAHSMTSVCLVAFKLMSQHNAHSAPLSTHSLCV